MKYFPILPFLDSFLDFWLLSDLVSDELDFLGFIDVEDLAVFNGFKSSAFGAFSLLSTITLSLAWEDSVFELIRLEERDSFDALEELREISFGTKNLFKLKFQVKLSTVTSVILERVKQILNDVGY